MAEKKINPGGGSIEKRTAQDIIDDMRKKSAFPDDDVTPFIYEYLFGMPQEKLDFLIEQHQA